MADEYLWPVRNVAEYAYCPRLFYLMEVEGIHLPSADTEQGQAVHRRADRISAAPAEDEESADADKPKVVRSMTLTSNKLNLTATLDLAEITGNVAIPVEYRKGHPKRAVMSPPPDEVEEAEEPALCNREAWPADRIQVGLQAILLEEAGYKVTQAILYYAAEKIRLKVEVEDTLKSESLKTLEAVKICASGPRPLPLLNDSRCPKCSLQPICLPDEVNYVRAGESLGEEETPRKIWPPRDDGIQVVIQQQGAKIGVKGQAMIITDKEGLTVKEVPIVNIESISILGSVHISTQAEHTFADCGVPDYDYTARIEAVSIPPGVIFKIEDPEVILDEKWAYFDDEGCTWRNPLYAQGKVAYVNLIKADITYANVTEDKIHINLGPSDLTGTLKLELTRPGASHTIREVTRASGSYDESFNIPNLATGEYTKVKATWTVNDQVSTDEYNYHIQVLGVYRHSRYVLSNESCYSGSSESFCYTSGDCVDTPCSWTTGGSGNSNWLSAMVINGSGYSSSLGYVTFEQYCQDRHPPPSECTGKLLRDLTISSGCPECVGYDLGINSTVAVKSNHPYLNCGDRVFVYEVGIRTVTDKGNLPNGQYQLDHFVGLQDCGTTYTDIGNFMTIKLFD